MGDLIENDPEKFIEDVGSLEYNNCETGNLHRLSLYRQFDPLISSTKTPVRLPNNNAANNLHVDENPQPLNDTNTLIRLNTTVKTDCDENESVLNVKSNGNAANDDSSNQQIVQMNEEIGLLETKNENLGLVIAHLTLLNEDIINLSMNKITNLQETIFSKEDDLNKLSMIKNQLEEDLNGIEKNYYEIHSRYDNLRTLVKEMDQKESQDKAKIQDLSIKLKERENECLKWKHQAEEASEKYLILLKFNYYLINLLFIILLIVPINVYKIATRPFH